MELNDVAVERWVKGDDGAFRDIFSAACHEVYWLAMRVLQNDAAAEDVVQETFLLTVSAVGLRLKRGKELLRHLPPSSSSRRDAWAGCGAG